METSFTGIGNNEGMFPNQSGHSFSKLPRFARGKQPLDTDEGFTSVEDNSDFLASEGDGSGSEMDIAEDYPSETRAIMRKDSAFCVPLIRVEDWSFSESDMEDDFEDALPPFSFVGTREKVRFFFCIHLPSGSDIFFLFLMRGFFNERKKISLPSKDINIAFDDVNGGTFVLKSERECLN